MKLAVEFPSVAYREGGAAVVKLAQGIEAIGYDHIDMFDHVIMGYPTDSRPAPIYPPQMPIMEALMTLSFIASATSRVGLGTEVLVLPQRQPVLVAKQVATLDTLSGGRVRLGVGVGWQASEYDALEERFDNRGKRMDEAIQVLRAYWGDERVDFAGEHYSATAMAMEPKPPQGRALPIWIGGGVEAALKRVGEHGDGWLSNAIAEPAVAAKCRERISRHAEAAGRDPAAIGYQQMLALPPRDKADKAFYADREQVVRRTEAVAAMGFDWAALNATAIFQAGARSVDAMLNELGELHTLIHAATG